MVKVGGSLALQPEKLRSLCAKLSDLSHRHRLIVVPGGGEFADTVRNVDDRFSLSPATAHRMAILGMDQYGLLLAELTPNSRVVREFGGLQEALDSGYLPVFLPSAFLFSREDLDCSWDVTSDSIAVYIAGELHLKRAVLVTDVDGIYACDPKMFREAQLIRKLSAGNLMKMNERTSVDKYLPRMLLKTHIECFIVNGLNPQRVAAILAGKDAVCTQITSGT